MSDNKEFYIVIVSVTLFMTLLFCGLGYYTDKRDRAFDEKVSASTQESREDYVLCVTRARMINLGGSQCKYLLTKEQPCR